MNRRNKINFTQLGKVFVLSLHIFLFVNATNVYDFKAKDTEINSEAKEIDYDLCVVILQKILQLIIWQKQD